VVTFNPVTKRKKLYDFARKMERLRSDLIEYRRKYQSREPQWRSPTKITSRYHKLCEDLYISPKYYRLTFANGTMSFRKDPQEISAHQRLRVMLPPRLSFLRAPRSGRLPVLQR
jgi:hypothetical protein